MDVGVVAKSLHRLGVVVVLTVVHVVGQCILRNILRNRPCRCAWVLLGALVDEHAGLSHSGHTNESSGVSVMWRNRQLLAAGRIAASGPLPKRRVERPANGAPVPAAGGSNWGGRADSNRRIPGSQPGALPTELQPPWRLQPVPTRRPLA